MHNDGSKQYGASRDFSATTELVVPTDFLLVIYLPVCLHFHDACFSFVRLFRARLALCRGTLFLSASEILA